MARELLRHAVAGRMSMGLVGALLISCMPSGGEIEPPAALLGIWCGSHHKGIELRVITADSMQPALVGKGLAYEELYKQHGKSTVFQRGGTVRYFTLSEPTHGEESFLVVDDLAYYDGSTDGLGPLQYAIDELSDEKLSLRASAETVTDWTRIQALPALDATTCTGPGAGGNIKPADTFAAARIVLGASTTLADEKQYPLAVASAGGALFAAAWADATNNLSVAVYPNAKSARWTKTIPTFDTLSAPTALAVGADGSVILGFPYRKAMSIDGQQLDAWGGNGPNAFSRSVAVASFAGSTGKAAWLRHIGGPKGDDDVGGVELAADGTAFVAAVVRGSPVYVAPSTNNAKTYDAKALFTRLGATGSPTAVLRFSHDPANLQQAIHDTASDGSGDVRVLVSANVAENTPTATCQGVCLRVQRPNLDLKWGRVLDSQPRPSGRVALWANGDALVAIGGGTGGGLRLARLAEGSGELTWQNLTPGNQWVTAAGVLDEKLAVIAGYTVDGTKLSGWIEAWSEAGKAAWRVDLGTVTDGYTVTALAPWSAGKLLMMGRNTATRIGGAALPSGVFVAQVSFEVLP